MEPVAWPYPIVRLKPGKEALLSKGHPWVYSGALAEAPRSPLVRLADASGTVLAWDRGKFQGTPSWQDFWDIARVPGKRGLQRSPRGTLEIALLADGVAPGDVYRALRGDDGVQRAFRRLDQLLPYIVWWAPGARAGAGVGWGRFSWAKRSSTLASSGTVLARWPSERAKARTRAGLTRLTSTSA